ncbi:MAG TPA: hypothetical protein VM285_09410 [Polyangia bacterium]|nr:hypothetical protein [Thermoleophilia bacterium]HUT77891.1 hypothetical protein [Polyangia bacterium]
MMTPSHPRDPENYFERMVWLYGRKFWVAFFAGSSSFLVATGGIWVIARTSPDTGTIIAGVVAGYFTAAGFIAGGYYASNAYIERGYIPATAGAPNRPRQSGTIQSPINDA